MSPEKHIENLMRHYGFDFAADVLLAGELVVTPHMLYAWSTFDMKQKGKTYANG